MKMNISALRSLIFLLVVAMVGCTDNKQAIKINPEFAKYVDSYTSGTVSRHSSVIIRLQTDVAGDHAIGEPLKEKLFLFSPSVKGDAVWVDDRTIEFRPSEEMRPAELYEVAFSIGKVADMPKGLETFRFNIETLKPSFSVDDFGLKVAGESKTNMSFSGQVLTADKEDTAAIKKIVAVSADGKAMPISWTHDASGTRHVFFVEGIKRNREASDLLLAWEGSAIKSDMKGSQNREIPAVGDFKVLNIVGQSDGENAVLVQFSAPIAADNDLRGLIEMESVSDLTYEVQGSEVKMYVPDDLVGTRTVSVNSGIKSSWGEKLKKEYSVSLYFEDRKPFVKILGKGEILPTSGAVKLPFEAGNLSAVDVSIIRIYESNIPQFFQENSWSNDAQLRKVGKPVVQKTIRLDTDKTLDLRKTQRFSLDIDRLVNAEPGAMYRVMIGFRPEYSLYGCKDGAKNNDSDEDYYYYDHYYGYDNWSDEDDAFWQMYDNYYPFGYDWNNSKNPCYPSYYNKERWETRNILVSNLGLTVKQGNDKSLTVFVTDLVSAQAAGSVQLEVLDYQRRVVHRTQTDANGTATFTLKNRPFLLVAKRADERGYLKLDEDNSLAISRFDVSGTEVQNGIKGFIYGERGVWRPGDSLFINFILEDKGNALPDNHPVSFSFFNPNGQLHSKQVVSTGVEGTYSFRLKTDAGAPTGNWLAKVEVGGASFEKRIKVETIMPNRLKIFLDIKDGVLTKGAGKPLTLSSQWLFGAPAQNLAAKVDVALFADKTAFPAYKSYIFEDPFVRFNSVTTSVFDGKLNSEGVASFVPKIGDLDDAPGMLKANFMVKVFEPGGAFSIDQISASYSPYGEYVGIKVPEGQEPWNYLLTGKQYSVDLVNVTPDGKPVSGTSEVEVAFYKMQWRWWWDNSGGSANYASSHYNKLVKRSKATLTNGKGKTAISVPEDDWGRYLVVVTNAEGHRTGKIVYFDDPYWQSRNRQGDESSATMLSFSADKVEYKVGELVTLSIPSSEKSKIFISIENGRKVLQSTYIDGNSGQTSYQFKVTPDMAPNVYVYVSLIQPHAQTENNRPIRMYGLLPLDVKDANTILKPSIQAPEVIRPEQPFSITVSEQSSKEMVYSLAIVDEGLLDLTRFKTPDPHAVFYAKEALGVKTWDIFDHVIGSQGGNFGRILTIGGDDGIAPGKQKGVNRFEPVVRYLGVFRLGKGEKKTHIVTLPPYFGSVRIMVVAQKNAQYGSAEKTVAVRSPLMVNGTLPRVLGPSEEINIPVTVFATEASVKTVSVEVESSSALDIAGGNKKTVTFTKPGEQTVFFSAKVKPYTGKALVKVKATSGTATSQHVTAIEVRNPNPAVTRVESQSLSAGASWNGKASPIGVPADAKATLELSLLPPINLEKRIGYLVQYPHGCVEQITSAAFAQLLLPALVDVDETRKKEIERNVKSAINRLKSYQQPDGSLGYWPGDTKPNEWGTNYAGHFLIEAKAKGYAVPEELMSGWLKFQKGQALKWKAPSDSRSIYGSELTQAYRLYLLSLAKSPEIGAMNRFKEFAYVSVESKWRLAAAYKLAGYDRVADAMVKSLPTEFTSADDYGYTYGSPVRNKAMVLEACAILGLAKPASSLAEEVAAELSSDKWHSTQSTAYSLVALARYSGASGAANKVEATVTVNGKNIPVNGKSYVTQVTLPVNKGETTFAVANKGKSMLHARLVRSGQPMPGDTEAESASASNVSLSVEYVDFSGKPVKISDIKQGRDFVVRAKVTNTGHRGTYKNMALSMILPSGWEIINTRLWDSESTFASSPATYQDIRDDRVYTYFDLREGETKTYTVMVNAAYAGTYYLPMISAQAMYDNTISATTSARWVSVNP